MTREDQLRLCILATLASGVLARASQGDDLQNSTALGSPVAQDGFLALSSEAVQNGSAILASAAAAYFAAGQQQIIDLPNTQLSSIPGKLLGWIQDKLSPQTRSIDDSFKNDSQTETSARRTRVQDSLEPKQSGQIELPIRTVGNTTYQVFHETISPNGLEVKLRTTFPNGTITVTPINEVMAGKQEAQSFEIIAEQFGVICSNSNNPNVSGAADPIMDIFKLSDKSKIGINNTTRTESLLIPDFFGTVPFTPVTSAIGLPTAQGGIEYEPNQFKVTLIGENPAERISKTFVIENGQCFATEQFLTKPSTTISTSLTSSPTLTPPASPTPTISETPSGSEQPTPTISASPTTTISETPSGSEQPTPTMSASPTTTISETPSTTTPISPTSTATPETQSNSLSPSSQTTPPVSTSSSINPTNLPNHPTPSESPLVSLLVNATITEKSPSPSPKADGSGKINVAAIVGSVGGILVFLGGLFAAKHNADKESMSRVHPNSNKNSR